MPRMRSWIKDIPAEKLQKMPPLPSMYRAAPGDSMLSYENKGEVAMASFTVITATPALTEGEGGTFAEIMRECTATVPLQIDPYK